MSFFVGTILLLGMMNGLFSPYILLTHSWIILFSPAFLISDPSVLVFLVHMFTATGFIILSGIPAGLYETFLGQSQSSVVSLSIWVGTLLVMSIPAIEMIGYAAK